MPETVVDLGKRVKAKYPGQYDDLDDADLGRRVKAKYPGAYDDFTDVVSRSFQLEQTPESRGLEAANIGQNILGAAKGVGNLVFGAYQWGQDIPRQVRESLT